MIRTSLLSIAAASLLRVCGHSSTATAPAAAALNGATPSMIPEHGGSVAVSGGMMTEVAALPDGRMVAYVRDPQHAPVANANVQLDVRKPDGQLLPVPVTYDATMQAYVGRPTGITPGAYPVQVNVQPPGAATPVQIVTPPVNVATVTPVPPARYGGQVQIVGDHAVEMVATPSGEMAMFWMNLDGTPIPASQVQAPNVTVTVNGRPHVVPTRIENDRIIARVPVAPSAPVAVAVPRVTVEGVPYYGVVAPATPVVAVMPPPVPTVVAPPPVVRAGFFPPPPPSVAVVAPAAPSVVVAPPSPPGVFIAPPAPSVVVNAPAPPAVVVAPPAPAVVVAPPRPGVFIAPPAPAVVVGAPGVGVEVEREHGPHGHAYGYWGHRGGEVVVGAPGPAVVVGPPRPGVVVVGGGGRGGWHGGGHGRH